MHYLISVIDDAETSSSPPINDLEDGTAVDTFNDGLRADGHWVYAGPLAAPGSAAVIDARGDQPVFSDGPFLESKEHLGGLWIIEAADIDEALQLASEGSRACNRRVEVRAFADE